MINKNNNDNLVKPTTSEIDGKVIVTFVYTKENDGFHGFAPGYKFKDILSHSLDECETKLKEKVYKELLIKRDSSMTFPFSPTEKEVRETFDFVVKIERIEYDLNEM